MRCWLVICLSILPVAAMGCERPVCLTDDPVRLSDHVTFDDQPASMGPGRPIDGVLRLPGASFGERFAGQSLTDDRSFDLVTGPGARPLTLVAGETGYNLSILRLAGTNVLSGDGPLGFPDVAATGEGAMAVLFDQDQAALRLDLRGGEGGRVLILFLARDGRVIDSHTIGHLAESTLTFVRQGTSEDIAGIVLSNRDPEGIALDTLSFGSAHLSG